MAMQTPSLNRSAENVYNDQSVRRSHSPGMVSRRPAIRVPYGVNV